MISAACVEEHPHPKKDRLFGCGSIIISKFKRGIRMLQTVMQQNLLFYGIGILSFFGVISQIWLWMIYGRMTKDMENERAAKGKLIRQIRQRYGLLKRMGDGNVNTQAFIERSLYQYRHLGRTLHQWRRTGTVTLVLSLVLAAAGYYYAGKLRMGLAVRQDYLWAMGIAAAVTALVYGLTDVRYRRSYLETGLLDLLENSGNAAASGKSAKDASQPEKSPAVLSGQPGQGDECRGQNSASLETAAVADKLPFRKNKKAAARMQQEKKELKADLSRIRASVGETAAGGESEKERKTEVLRNMDPAEQERIIREVLKEILS